MTGLHNEIAHRAIHLSAVLGLCFLVFPRQARLRGHWEWTVSAGLAAVRVTCWPTIGARSEGNSSIGGHMAQLDKTFPTNDCAM